MNNIMIKLIEERCIKILNDSSDAKHTLLRLLFTNNEECGQNKYTVNDGIVIHFNGSMVDVIDGDKKASLALVCKKIVVDGNEDILDKVDVEYACKVITNKNKKKKSFLKKIATKIQKSFQSI